MFEHFILSFSGFSKLSCAFVILAFFICRIFLIIVLPLTVFNDDYALTIGAVILARAVILACLTFGAHLTGLNQNFDLIFFSNETSGNSVYESKKKSKKMLF